MRFTDVLGKNFALKNTIKKINGVEVEIKGYLDVDTFADIVHVIADTCFENGEYKAENREIARRYVILKYMTNIDVSEDEINEIFKSTQAGNWFEDIAKEVERLPIWGEVETAIDLQILAHPSAFDRLCDSLSSLISTDQSAKLSDVKQILEKLDRVDKRDFVEAVVESNLAKEVK